jgi:hypothetical protein
MEQAATLVTIDELRKSVPMGPEPDPILASIEKTRDAGIEYIYLHQIGDPLDGFIEFWGKELQPNL